ncbi:MAG: TonB-dependent receptor [Bacteroidales bacterium]|nr:TonB-dependent receptor [Bacteroidales bacterium]
MKRKLPLLIVSLLFMSAQLLHAQHTVTGTVISGADGKPVPMASVVIKGSSPVIGVATDLNGHYSLNVPPNSTLVFSFTGLETKEIVVGVQSSINVTLGSTVEELKAVVVTGFGNIKKSAYTGSAEVINSEDIAKIQTSNITKSIEGLVAGVEATSNSGQPGSSMKFKIRGQGSINAGTAPLYVVDGVVYNGEISAINPDDVENISILKDAATSTLYGARAANGVILITTKKGRSKDFTINLKATVGLSTRAIPNYDVVNQAEFYELWWTLLKNKYIDGGDDVLTAGLKASGNTAYGVIANLNGYNCYDPASYSGYLIDPVTGKVKDGAKLLWNDSWEKELLKMGVAQNYQISISKGDDKNNLYASLGYQNETGIVPNTKFRRISGRISTTNHISKWLKIDFSLAGTQGQSDNQPSDGTNNISNPFSFVRKIPAIYPVYQHDPVTGNILKDEEGNLLYDFGGGFGLQPGVTSARKYNPNYNLVATIPLDFWGEEKSSLNSRINVDIDIWGGIKATVLAGYDIANFYVMDYSNSKWGEGEPYNGVLGRIQQKTNTFTLREGLSFARTFAYKHNVYLAAGHETYDYKLQQLSAYRNNFPTYTPDISLGVDALSSNSKTDRDKVEGFYALANYDYDSKYYVSGTYRREGSSRFHPDLRWDNFYSASLAWVISRENFMQNTSKWLDFLKFRASYGKQGNCTGFGLYQYQNLYENLKGGGYVFTILTNERLKWEGQHMINVGIDFAMFRNFSGSIDLYDRITTDMIMSKRLSTELGASAISTNIGSMRNMGVEVNLGYTIFDTKNFKWDIGLNITHNNNKMLKMAPEDSLGVYFGSDFLLKEGHSIYEYCMPEFAGLDENGNALYYALSSGTDSVTSNYTSVTDRQHIRYQKKLATPAVYGGFNTSFYLYGFDLSISFAYSIGGWTYDSEYAALMNGTSQGGTLTFHRDLLNAWSEENPNSQLPRLTASTTGTGRNYQYSTQFLVDASYLTLKNVTLGYTIPENLTNKIHIKNIRAFITLDNYLTVTARKGLMPQTSGSAYYPVKTMTFGLNVTF